MGFFTKHDLTWDATSVARDFCKSWRGKKHPESLGNIQRGANTVKIEKHQFP